MPNGYSIEKSIEIKNRHIEPTMVIGFLDPQTVHSHPITDNKSPTAIALNWLRLLTEQKFNRTWIHYRQMRELCTYFPKNDISYTNY